MLLLAGCGGTKDPTLFIMAKNGLSSDATEALTKSLQAKFGDTKIQVSSSPIYNQQKLIVELAAGGNAVMMLDKDDFVSLLGQGGALSLDDVFDPKLYPEGVLEGTIPGDKDEPDRKETHLYGIPVTKAKLVQSAGINDDKLILFIPANAPDQEAAKQMIKELVES
ncbi:hypothetical protein VN24_02085 [Paenibacillus beijingensis]|uniref:ABC transporter substrate-binding protein n=2 Tax=Paenibacillus beijingensis TaxID=1126833 RepID=A0A0D5NQ40_9BACL|nr:hypothetical protein VN24_02085 [Paenibacillus beijingensis]